LRRKKNSPRRTQIFSLALGEDESDKGGKSERKSINFWLKAGEFRWRKGGLDANSGKIDGKSENLLQSFQQFASIPFDFHQSQKNLFKILEVSLEILLRF
jgi:hypothetical protein